MVNDSNFDRSPLRGCNYGSEEVHFDFRVGAVLCQRKRSAFME